MTEREELRQLLSEHGILRSAPGQPIGGRDQSRAPWMFYSWDVTMTARGAHLAARCVLDVLRGFEADQIATYGVTAMPILSGCLLLGEGRYSGLCVREKRKQHGSMRRVDGPADRSRPVVVIDDSISSGTAMLGAIEGLEAEGFRVEGCVALVCFPWRGGVERLRALGYRVETVFDIWRDLGAEMPKWTPILDRVMPAEWGPRAIPDGLHPAVAARQAAKWFLEDGRVPHPPRSLDAEYDARGGTFVSFRWRDSDIRVWRDGFWHFDEGAADPCRDLILATVKTVRDSRGGITAHALADLKIAATFFGPLERVLPRDLDFGRYGIVVRSRAHDYRMGGALPNTQVYISEYEQYRHARVINARLGRFEPHDIFRHTLTKCVEPGAYWLPFGFPREAGEWTADPVVGDVLARRGEAWVCALARETEPAGAPLEDTLIPAPVSCVAVTLYAGGVMGCGLAWGGSLDDCVRRAAQGALRDPRYEPSRAAPIEDMDVSVSVLHDREWHGTTTAAKAAFKLRRGLDSLAVQQGSRRAIFLPIVMPWFNWSKDETARRLMAKAGIRGGPCAWSTFPTATWLRRRGRTWKLSYGFPERSKRSDARDDLRLLAGYVRGQQDEHGLPAYLYYPVTGQTRRTGSPARQVHALWMMREAADMLGDDALRARADAGVAWCAGHLDEHGLALPGVGRSPVADALMLAALSVDPSWRDDRWKGLGARVSGWVREDGRVTERPASRGLDVDHDFFPGLVLLALARFRQAGGPLALDLAACLAWYRRRFQQVRGWGAVGWQTRAWSALHEVPGAADFVFELADHATDSQVVEGWYMTDLHGEGPSFHTAFIAEGMADAWALARRLGEHARAARYGSSCEAALRFMDRLVIREEDTFCMPDGSRALGGVRGGVAESDVRIDFVSHHMGALLGTCRARQEALSCQRPNLS